MPSTSVLLFILFVEVSIEMEQQSSDRLSALHTRLQLEAEKIRKWKNATESEIRDKVNLEFQFCIIITF